MCGFAGYVGKTDWTLLASMTSVVAHRGPDDENFWVDEDSTPPVNIGFRRLVVVDPDGGEQPMLSADGRFILVFNGEIYNHRELRGELESLGSRFRSDHSDTEVLLEGYRHWGTDVVKRLNGMFAFVIYDRSRRLIIFARDRFGKKPLYYFQRKELLAFGSELSCLIQHPDIPSNTSPISLARYFAFGHVPAPDTLYEGIRKVPAGTIMTYEFTTRRLSEQRFWRYRIKPTANLPGTSDDWADEIRLLLDAATKRRLSADVPLGFLLSGGMDSSAIVGLAAGHLTEGNARTFALGFGEASFDERSYANLVSNCFDTRHEERTIDLADARRELPEIYRQLDEPIVDGSLLPTHLVCCLARENVTVALSGDGGDELFAGYDPFAALRLASIYRQIIPQFMHGMLQNLARCLPVSDRNMSLDFRLNRALRGVMHKPSLWNPIWMAPADVDEIERITGQRYDAEELYKDVVELWDDCESDNLVDRSLEFYASYYFEGILTKVDRASMLCSLEVRSPFLDKDLVDFVLQLPADVKFKKNSGKWLLRKALKKLLPQEIISRPKKGFGIPMARWLREMPAPTRDSTEQLGLNADYLSRLWREHCTRKSDHRGALWAWLTLDLASGIQ